MPDLLGLDPGRIQRLRDPLRYQLVDPSRLWEVTPAPMPEATIVDVGAGVGFVTLPFAERFPSTRFIACDVLEGMLNLLDEDAATRNLDNVSSVFMTSPTELPLADASADVIVMLQVHHELDEASALLTDCVRVLVPDGRIAIIDWKDEDLDGVPPPGRRVSDRTIIEQLTAAGLRDAQSHDVYTHHSLVMACK